MWPFSRRETKAQNYLAELTDINELADLLTGLSSGQPVHIMPREAYHMNERNNDLGDATSRISSSLAGLHKGIQRGQKIDYNHPLIQILNQPKDVISGLQLWREGTEGYLLTSECWIVARGRVSSPPLSLVVLRPYDVDVVMDSDGLPRTISTQCNRDRRVYERVSLGGFTRYIDRLKLNEIFPIIGVTSMIDEWRGRSPLAQLFYDIDMSTDGKRHNVSLLKNGMRTTGILTPKPVKDGNAEWGESVVSAIGKKLRTFHQGAGNAGNVLIMGRPADMQGITQNNRDMDFLNLLKVSQVAIYNRYKIPLPLVLPDTMTLDNYTQAQRSYYQNAVFPVFEELGQGIIGTIGAIRYGMDPTAETMVYNETAIRALRPVLVENMKQLGETGAVTVNEVRAVGGFEPDTSGDVILVGANLVPLNAVGMTSFNDSGNGPDNEGDGEQEES